jgi:predicted nucleotidyltransferase
LENVRAVLEDYFIGMYLHGSLAIGEFDSDRSDIDFLVVTRDELPRNLITDLETMHKLLYDSGKKWTTRLEGAYMPLYAMPVHRSDGPACPLVHEREFLVTRPDSHWVIIRHILYTQGVVIIGPPPQTFIDPVQPEQLRQAVLTLLRQNWTPWLDHPEFFTGEGYQPYVVLTMCRARYTLVHGAITTKLRAAEWAIANSDRRWTRLIKQAMAWHYGDPPGDIRKTQEFMRFILRKAGL